MVVWLAAAWSKTTGNLEEIRFVETSIRVVTQSVCIFYNIEPHLIFAESSGIVTCVGRLELREIALQVPNTQVTTVQKERCKIESL